MIKLKTISFRILSSNFFESAYFWTLTEIKRRTFFYILTVISILLVISTAIVSQSLIEISPLIFMRSAEHKKGKIDIKLEPRLFQGDQNDFFNTFGNEIYHLNYTKIKKLLE